MESVAVLPLVVSEGPFAEQFLLGVPLGEQHFVSTAGRLRDRSKRLNLALFVDLKRSVTSLSVLNARDDATSLSSVASPRIFQNG